MKAHHGFHTHGPASALLALVLKLLQVDFGRVKGHVGTELRNVSGPGRSGKTSSVKKSTTNWGVLERKRVTTTQTFSELSETAASDRAERPSGCQIHFQPFGHSGDAVFTQFSCASRQQEVMENQKVSLGGLAAAWARCLNRLLSNTVEVF